MGCKHSKVINNNCVRPKSPQESPRRGESRKSPVGQDSPRSPVRLIHVQPVSRPASPVPPRLASSVSNTTFTISRGSPSLTDVSPQVSWDEELNGRDTAALSCGGRDTAALSCGGRDSRAALSPVPDGRLTRTIIRACEHYKFMNYVNCDDVSDVVEVYNFSDDSDADDEHSSSNKGCSPSDSDPMLARGNRTPEMVRKIRAFEKDVSSLLVAQAIPGCSTTYVDVRPKAAKGVCTSCIADASELGNETSDGVSLESGHQMSRPQLTVAGLSTAGDNCLNSCMKRQQGREMVEEDESGDKGEEKSGEEEDAECSVDDDESGEEAEDESELEEDTESSEEEAEEEGRVAVEGGSGKEMGYGSDEEEDSDDEMKNEGVDEAESV